MIGDERDERAAVGARPLEMMGGPGSTLNTTSSTFCEKAENSELPDGAFYLKGNQNCVNPEFKLHSNIKTDICNVIKYTKTMETE